MFFSDLLGIYYFSVKHSCEINTYDYTETILICKEIEAIGRVLLLFSCSVVSDSLRPHGLQHARLPCPSLFSRPCSNSCLLSWWCHPTISFYAAPLSSCPQFSPASWIFSNESALCIRWPKHESFSFSISPSNEYSGKIIALAIQTFVNKVMSLLINTLSRFVIALLPRSKYL